jgi:RAB protein geranylgeranyltransferase component A
MSEAIESVNHGVESEGESPLPDSSNNANNALLSSSDVISSLGDNRGGSEGNDDTTNDENNYTEGLRKSYDVIICGTGLTQSILAAALSRAGKTVLHVDGAEYYGGLDAVWTYPFLQCQWKKTYDTTTTTTTRPGNMSATTVTTTTENVMEEDIVPLHEAGESQSFVFHSVERHSPKTISMDQIVVTPYGKGTVVNLVPASTTSLEDHYYQLTISLALSNWTLANGTAPTLYVGIPSWAVIIHNEDATTKSISHPWSIDADYLWQQCKIQSWPAFVSSHIFDRQSRSLAFDLTPYLIYADGPAVNGLIESSVSEYLEFKSLQAIYYVSKDKNNKKTNPHCCTRVPCSKNDIFASKLLSPMDKRRLMKFLQTAMDFAAAAAEDVAATTMSSSAETMTEDGVDQVQFFNERHLNQGRSLSRPQNKPVNSTDLEFLQDLCRRSPPVDGTPLPSACHFETYLREHQKLSPELIPLVRYALTLETGDESFHGDNKIQHLHPGTENSTKSGMQRLCAHMRALGRFGTTAFLVPLYGSGELTQAFCRCAAVYGATYLLRRTPVGIRLQTSTTGSTTVKAQQQEEKCSKRSVQAVILQSSPDNPQHDPTQTIACTHVIVSEGALMENRVQSTGKRVLRRISIISGKPMMAMMDDEERPLSQPEQQQRNVLIIPPGTIAEQTSTIHVLFLDEGVNVAPHVPGGCTVAHLTTTVQSNASNDVPESLLKDALQLVLDLCSKSYESNSPGTPTPTELFHASFSYALFPKDDLAWSDCSGMHVLHRPRPGLSADQSFEQSAQVFHDICPGQEFLKISQDLEKTIQERLGDQAPEDDDKRVLESALEMIGALPTEKAADTSLP